MKRRAFIIVSSCLLVAGCGGGQGSHSSQGDGSDHTAAVGIATVQYSGPFVPAAVFSSSGVTVTSMGGASFSNVTLNPAPKKENSALVFAMGGQIFAYQNGASVQITNQAQQFANPTVAKNGLVVFFRIRSNDHQQPAFRM